MKTNIILLLATTLTGCTVTKYVSGSGESFTRTSFGTRLNLSELTVTGDTNGVRTITMKGYANDQVEAISAVTAAAVSAAVKSVKP